MSIKVIFLVLSIISISEAKKDLCMITMDKAMMYTKMIKHTHIKELQKSYIEMAKVYSIQSTNYCKNERNELAREMFKLILELDSKISNR